MVCGVCSFQFPVLLGIACLSYPVRMSSFVSLILSSFPFQLFLFMLCCLSPVLRRAFHLLFSYFAYLMFSFLLSDRCLFFLLILSFPLSVSKKAKPFGTIFDMQGVGGVGGGGGGGGRRESDLWHPESHQSHSAKYIFKIRAFPFSTISLHSLFSIL